MRSEKYNKYLMIVLNSKIMEWYLDKVSSSTGVGTNQWSKIFVEQLPIPILSDDKIVPFNIIADYLIYLNSPIQSSTESIILNYSEIAILFDKIANQMVFELYFYNEMKNQNVNIIEFIDFESIHDKSDTQKRLIILNTYNHLISANNKILNRTSIADTKCDFISVINNETCPIL